jgi:hypothetical protein
MSPRHFHPFEWHAYPVGAALLLQRFHVEHHRRAGREIRQLPGFAFDSATERAARLPNAAPATPISAAATKQHDQHDDDQD